MLGLFHELARAMNYERLIILSLPPMLRGNIITCTVIGPCLDNKRAIIWLYLTEVNWSPWIFPLL